MKNSLFRVAVVITLIAFTLLLQTCKVKQAAGLAAGNNTVTIYFHEYTPAFRNPLKGFRGGKYATLEKTYIKWNAIENNASDGVEKIRSYSDSVWNNIEKSNTKAIPRVYLEWPGAAAGNVTGGDSRDAGKYWPADMKEGDYTSDQFKQRVLALIKKMSAAWDRDPRVAYVEMGLIGFWGEHHSPLISPAMQVFLGEAFKKYFKNKLIMVRHPWDFKGYNFGIYWDSYLHPEQQDHVRALELTENKSRWKTTVYGGEMAFDWGQKLGDNPTDAVVNHSKTIVDYTYKLHWNHIGWVSSYDQTNATAATNAQAIQKALGYRFIINYAKYNVYVNESRKIDLEFGVKNTGSSPFYNNWPVEISLLEPSTFKPVWKATIPNVDITKWLPGEDRDLQAGKYKIAPQVNRINTSLTIPSAIKNGEYLLALAILDPAGNVPAARFAIINYKEGGRHPLGRIGMGVKMKSYELKPSTFDDLATDNSLYYLLR